LKIRYSLAIISGLLSGWTARLRREPPRGVYSKAMDDGAARVLERRVGCGRGV
jgi:hypothetical protein